ncbi:unnamed protein product, partial [Prorocentrum cordatum]
MLAPSDGVGQSRAVGLQPPLGPGRGDQELSIPEAHKEVEHFGRVLEHAVDKLQRIRQ